jgi:hypothetical protein
MDERDAYEDEGGAREKIRSLMLLDRQRGKGMQSYETHEFTGKKIRA